MELDVRERLPGPGQRDLAVGRAVGVVEGRPWACAAWRSARRSSMVSAFSSRRVRGDSSGFLNLSSGRRSCALGSWRFIWAGFSNDPWGSWWTICWVRATSARRSSRLPDTAPCRATLHQHIAQRGRLDRAGQHRELEPVGEQPAEQGVLGAAADHVHPAYVAARQRRSLPDRRGEPLGEAGHDAAHHRDPALRGRKVVLAAPRLDPRRLVARREEPWVLSAESTLGAA